MDEEGAEDFVEDFYYGGTVLCKISSLDWKQYLGVRRARKIIEFLRGRGIEEGSSGGGCGCGVVLTS